MKSKVDQIYRTRAKTRATFEKRLMTALFNFRVPKTPIISYVDSLYDRAKQK